MQRAAVTIRPMRLLAWMAVGLCVLAGSFLGVRAYQRYAAQQRWVSEFQRLNARVLTLSYADPARSQVRIPVINELLSHRSQAELFLYDAKTADQVLEKAKDFKELKRIWVNLNVFDRSMQKTIENTLPGMEVQFYTPGPGMR